MSESRSPAAPVAPAVSSLARSLRIDLSPAALGAIEWTPWREGIDIHRLYGDGESGSAAALLRYAPKAFVPRHEHHGYEHIYILSGFQEDDRGVYRPGTLVINPPGSRHEVRAPEGCIVYIVWERPVHFVPAG